MKRMSEESIRTDMARVQVEADRSEGATMALIRLEEELDRARRMEDVLADALEKYSVRILVIGEGNRLPFEVEKLLKELGRLP